ncbi:hypothetical protein AALM74_11885 [Parabacteroides segnis]|jgi:hypothetical protein|uniref:tRNA_anti-like n=1 Tax=Parabacteroides segnis TaxID=2763058 RepID=A0ABR7EB10_9BACT|nr:MULTISPECIES: hypothetical protein [Parabacteroides]MBC5646224.1 hypothetical protein [Parabacteroides segnis]MCM0716210.1 OB-fold putative lipoprotein [Parabacteroides sp. TA-V-105]
MIKKIASLTACIFILLLWAGGNTYLPASTITNGSNEIHANDSIMTAKELYDAFKKDEAAAKKQYSGKTITIKGFAVFIGPDVYALPSVELSEKKGGKSRILCVLPFSDYLKLRKVSKGDETVITGEVRGFYEKGDQVLLKQCEIKSAAGTP